MILAIIIIAVFTAAGFYLHYTHNQKIKALEAKVEAEVVKVYDFIKTKVENLK